MKAKNQPFTSELDAKEKLIVYVYEYLTHSGAKNAADIFKDTIGYSKDIRVNEGPGFLSDWWCVFWDLYCAAPERRQMQPEIQSSQDARAFHDYRLTPMSPSITPQQSSPPQFMGGPPRYGPPPPGQLRGPPPPRMQMPPQQHGPPPHPAGPPPNFIPSGSPRYHAQPPQPHMNQAGMFGPGPDHQMGPSPGPNRMTPVGGPPPPPPQQQIIGQQPQQVMGQPQQVVGPPQQVVGPPNGPPPQMVGMSSQQMGHGGPLGEPEEYVLPGVPYGQETSDQDEIMKLKQSMQDDTTKMFEKEQSEFNLGDYSDGQNKWS